MATKSLSGTVRGRVQGVGFRFFTREAGENLGVTGWVKNEIDGSVAFFVQGEPARVDAFVDQVKKGPSWAEVTDCQLAPTSTDQTLSEFIIRH